MRCPMGTASFALGTHACAGCSPSLPLGSTSSSFERKPIPLFWGGLGCLGRARSKIRVGDYGADTKISLDKIMLVY